MKAQRSGISLTGFIVLALGIVVIGIMLLYAYRSYSAIPV
jgi:hypothetical protein